MGREVLISSFYDRGIIKPVLDSLPEEVNITYSPKGKMLLQNELINYLKKGVEIVIAAEEPYTDTVFSSCPFLKLIARDGVGLDSIDLEAATKAGVIVINAPVVHKAVADLTMALLFSTIRKVTLGDKAMRRGEWNNRNLFLSEGVSGKTLGLYGFGRIGQEVAKRARAFDMSILAHDTIINKEKGDEFGVEFVSFDDLVKMSDILSIHVPLTKETRNLIDMEVIKKMKIPSWIINTSRGAIINENDLVEALKKNIITGAGLDVLTTEPPDISNPLFAMDNVVLTPHVGSDTKGTFQRVYQCLVDDIILYLQGKKPVHVVNPEVLCE